MRTIMSANGTQEAANGTRPARIMIIDDHEITRAVCRALLRTEGADVIADMPAGDQVLAAAAALRPDVVVVDVSPAAGAGFGLARQLHALPHPPAVVLTSSAEPAEFGTQLDGPSFIAKAGLCAGAIDAAACRASLGGRVSLGGCRRTGHGR